MIDSDNSFDGARSNTLSGDECTLERYAALERLQYSYLMSRKRLFTALVDALVVNETFRQTGIDRGKCVVPNWTKRMLCAWNAQGKIDLASLTRLS
jgi:hypothetical protein